MSNDYNMAILSVIKMIVDNNPGCVARELQKNGYETKNFIPSPELESVLFKLYIIDKKLFFKVMKNCEWNYGINNWTNDVKYRDQIISAIEKFTHNKVDKTNFWNTAINYLENIN